MALTVTKTASPISVEPGEIVTYTVIVTSDSAESKVVLTDITPSGACFISGSVTIDKGSGAIPDPTANPNDGIDLGAMAANETFTVTYKVKICPQPGQTTIENTAEAEGASGETNSDTAEVNVLIIDVVKTADVDLVKVGDTITYTVIVKNNGAVNINDIILKDTIPEGTSFVTDSVYVNGTQQTGEDPTSPGGIDISAIVGDPVVPGQTVVITFQVTVDSLECCTIILKNCAFVSFTYEKTDGGVDDGEKTIEACVVTQTVETTSFKQISVDENVTIPPQKPDSEQVLNVVVDVEITEVNVIETIVGTSHEGQVLTGFKAIIEGKLNQKVEYVADEPTQSVHVAEFKVPFSSYIVLPPDFVLGTPIEIEGFIEDVFYKQLDKRTIFKNVTLRLLAKYCK